MEKDNRWRNRMTDLLCLLAGAGLCVYTVLSARCLLGFGGDNGLAYTACSLVSKALYSRELPLWNPYIWGGLSNVGSPVGQAFYPVNWLLSLLFYDTDTQTLSYAILPASRIIHLQIYFCGVYTLLRHLKLSAASAFLAGILSTFSFTLMSFLAWAMYFEGCCWFPFLVLVSIKMFGSHGKKSLRYVGVLGVLWAVLALLSISHALVMSVFFCAVLLLLFMQREERQDRVFLLAKFVGSGVIGVFLSMPVLLATLAFVKNCARYIPDIGWVYETNDIPFADFALKHVLEIEDMRRLLEIVPTWSWLSVSGLALFLAILGVVSKKKLCAPLFLWSVIGVVFTFFYGIGMVFPDIVYYIPFLNNNRENFMYVPFFGFFVTVLVAEGISCIEKILRKNLPLEEVVKYPKVALWVSGGILAYNLLPHNCGSAQTVAYAMLLLLLAVSILWYGKNRGKRRKAVVICGIAACLALNFGLFYTAFDGRTYTEMDAIRKMSMVNETTKKMMSEIDGSGEEGFRIMAAGGSCYPENSGALLGVSDAIGYYNPIPKMAATIHENLNFEERSRLQNIKYFLATENNDEEFFTWFDAAYPDFEKREGEIYAYASYDAQEPTKVYVYDSHAALGEAWLVNDYELYFSDEEAIEDIKSASKDLGQIAFINGADLSDRDGKTLENMEGRPRFLEGSVACVERGLNHVKFEVNAQDSAILVTADTYFPGWNVTVNGKKGDVLQVDYCNRGVLVPGGKSEVEFTFRPLSVWVGFAFQMVGAILFLLCVFLQNKRTNIEF